MSKRTLALIIVLAIITVVLVVAATMPKQNPNSPSPISNILVKPTPVAQTTLKLSPNPIVTSSQSASAQVEILSGANKITAVQLELSFDPTKITNVTITPGTFFQNPIVLLNNIDLKNGKISYALGITPTGSPKTGQGSVALLTFQTALTSGQQTAIIFEPKSLATAEGVAPSVLKSALGTTILYIQPTAALPPSVTETK
ncbi:MAG: hypothetical protein HYT83_00185 [Candidatus Levybacteria bacterium]|nr:hypothetical protein [Candidatus Levybacteria bacterium]